MSGADLSRNEVIQMVVRVSLVSLVSYFSIKWYWNSTLSFRNLIVALNNYRMINQIDPTCKAKKKAKDRAVGLLKRFEYLT